MIKLKSAFLYCMLFPILCYKGNEFRCLRYRIIYLHVPQSLQTAEEYDALPCILLVESIWVN